MDNINEQETDLHKCSKRTYGHPTHVLILTTNISNVYWDKMNITVGAEPLKV